MFSGSMPNAFTPSAFVDTATKWFATASSPSEATSHSRALCAFVRVSSVVNVFEEMTKSVRAGSRSRVASAMSAPSTLDTNRHAMSRCDTSSNAS